MWSVVCNRPGAALLAFIIAAQAQGTHLALDLEKDKRIRALAGSSMPLGSRLGVNIHSLDDDVGLDSARAPGFGFVRMDLIWAQVEKNGRYDFANYDRLLSEMPSVPFKTERSELSDNEVERIAAAVVAKIREHFDTQRIAGFPRNFRGTSGE